MNAESKLPARPRVRGRLAWVVAICWLAAGCATTATPEAPPQAQALRAAPDGPGTERPTSAPAPASEPAPPGEGGREPVLRLGSGQFLSGDSPQRPWRQGRGGDVTLNFAEADLREVARVILGEILKVNYIIDPGVKGRASLQTSSPLRSADLIPVLESVLQLNGAALLNDGVTYQVVPLVNAVRLAPSSHTGERTLGGFGTQIVPLRYVSARSMRKSLEPFVGAGSQVNIEEGRNLLMITGPGPTVQRLLDTVRLFDADWLAGMSFGLFPLHYADAQSLREELELLLDTGSAESPLTNMLRIEPVERLNALLVVSKQPHYVEELGGLIQQLDQGLETPGRRLYVYPVRHSSAEYMAGVLRELFERKEEQPSGAAAPRPAPAPAQAPAPAPALPAAQSLGDGSVLEPPVLQARPSAPPPAPAAAPAAPQTSSSVESAGVINIIADEANNTVLVLASPQDYRLVEAAMKRLDVPPRQVLIESTIAEVTLNDNLQYGVQWFLDGRVDSYASQALFATGDSGQLPGFSVPGFSFALSRGVADVRFLFDILASESELKVLSSPKVLVVDNETASIRVGDQIPVITRQSSGTDADSAIVNEVQFRDTGVLLRVRPRINSGGLVTLEVSQEVSQPSADQFAAGNVSILQRTIESTIVVQSGEAVVLGGLIVENNTVTETGIPGLRDLPVIGKLFGRTVDAKNRTELLVTITPTVVENSRDAEAVTEELRRRLRRVGEWVDGRSY